MKKSEVKVGQRVRTMGAGCYGTVIEHTKATSEVKLVHGAVITIADKFLLLVAQPDWQCPECGCDTTHYRTDSDMDISIECTQCGHLVKAEQLLAADRVVTKRLQRVFDKAMSDMALAGRTMAAMRGGESLYGVNFSFGEFAGESEREIIESVTGLDYDKLIEEQKDALCDAFLDGNDGSEQDGGDSDMDGSARGLDGRARTRGPLAAPARKVIKENDMTKQAWIEHIKGTAANPYGPGLMAPSEGGNAEEWHRVLTAHRISDRDCPACKDRARTRNATTNRKVREQVYRDMGLVKVKGAVTGRTYWE